MSQEILVRHDEVYNLVGNLTSYIENEILCEAENRYAQIYSQLGQVDSATNAGLIMAMECNKVKTAACASTLQKLLALVEGVTRELEKEDSQMARDIGSEGGVK